PRLGRGAGPGGVPAGRVIAIGIGPAGGYSRRMNVIVVACNSLHLGFLGPYGNGWIETPNLDRLAAEGVVFDHHFPENLTTIPTATSGRGAGSNSSATARRSRPATRRTPASPGPSQRRSTGSNAGAPGPTRSSSGSTCSVRTGRGTRPSPTATSTPPRSPTS